MNKIDENTFKGKMINICCKHFPVYYEENPKYRTIDWDGFTKEVAAAVESLLPSEEEENSAMIEYATIEVENDEGGVDKFIAPTAEMFQDGAKWFRSRILDAIDAKKK